MTNKEALREIHRDHQKINKNLQHLANIGFMEVFGKSADKAKRDNDKIGRMFAKMGLLLAAVSEILLLVSEIIDYRNEKIEQKLIDKEEVLR